MFETTYTIAAMRAYVLVLFRVMYPGQNWAVQVGYHVTSVAHMDFKNRVVFINEDIWKFYPELKDKMSWKDLVFLLLVHEIGHILYTLPIADDYSVPGVDPVYAQVALNFSHMFQNVGEDNYLELPQGSRFGKRIVALFKLWHEVSYGPDKCQAHDAKFGTVPMTNWVAYYLLLLGYNKNYAFVNNPLGMDFVKRYREMVVLNNNETRQELELDLAREAFEFLKDLSEQEPPEGPGKPGDNPPGKPAENPPGPGNEPGEPGEMPGELPDDVNINIVPGDGPGQPLTPEQRRQLADKLEQLIKEMKAKEATSGGELNNDGTIEEYNGDKKDGLDTSNKAKGRMSDGKNMNAFEGLMPYKSSATPDYWEVTESFSVTLIKHLRKIMQTNRRAYVRGRKSGEIDNSKLIKSIETNAIFKKKLPVAKQHSISCAILMDVSSSTGRLYDDEACLQAEAKALLGMARVFNAFAIPYSIYSFGSWACELKSFNEKYEPVKSDFNDQDNEFRGGCTDLSPALEYASVELRARKEDVRICLIFTDGDPDDRSKTRAQVNRLRKDGVLVIPVIFSDPSYMDTFYRTFGDNAACYKDTDEFNTRYPKEFAKLLENNLYGLGQKTKKRR